MKKLSNKATKKEKIKGIALILLGIIGLIIYVIASFKEIKLSGGFFIILGSIGLIWEGLRMAKNQYSLGF